MTTQTIPYEILLRFRDGALSGAHYVEITRYLDGETLITEKQGLPQEIPTDLSESILGAVNTGLLARITELEAELAAAKAAPQPPDKSAIVAQTISALHAAFTSTLPGEAQASFAMPYAIVRVLVEAEQWQLASAVILGVAVPPELEPAKEGLIQIFADAAAAAP